MDIGPKSNNAAELYALVHALDHLLKQNFPTFIKNIRIFIDNQYAIKTTVKEWVAKSNLDLIHQAQTLLCRLKQRFPTHLLWVPGNAQIPGTRLLTGSPNAGPRATPLATPHQKISSTPVHQRVLAPWPLPLSVQTMSWLTTSPLRMMNKMVQVDPLRHSSHRPPQSLEGFVCQSLLSLQEGRREIPNRDSLHWPKAFSLAKGFPKFVCPPSFPFILPAVSAPEPLRLCFHLN